MSRAAEERNRRLLRARDAMDRSYAEPLDIAALARIDCGLRDPFGNQIRILQPKAWQG